MPDAFPLLRSRLLTGLCLTLVCAGVAASPGAGEPVPEGRTLPDMLMNGLNGPDRSLASYSGRKLIINIWASWCTPCRAEAASLERFAWSEAGSRYAVIGISTDDDRRAAERWLKQSNATLNHYLDRAVVLENMLGASRIPLTVLVDEHGRVITRVRGAQAWDAPEMLQLIEKAFAQGTRPRPRKVQDALPVPQKAMSAPR
ncbi:TlpA disulfide reductase family protein [Hydrogenophaga sp.]|uniref:TlpA family protein disulfide reductase n=1 Tax=Hydrogenophaga sp. TaxID=1904254 RepID=UPI0025B7AEE5|nr:TlpA disulfide reductase family protein [Hydrogenophaga sp.]